MKEIEPKEGNILKYFQSVSVASKVDSLISQKCD